MTPASYEVVILGGGPAGCGVALSLLAEGLAPERLLVVEASHYELDRIGESIPPNTRVLLSQLGILDGFIEQGHEPCRGSASSWGADELGYNDFMFNPFGNGWHLDRRRFDAWLAGEVVARAAELRRDTRFLDVHEHGADGASLSIGQPGGDRERVEARFVVDAMGPRSRYAVRMGAKPRVLDMLVSVTGQFELPAAVEFGQLTMLEAVDYGWWYAARLPNRRIATAVATSHAIYKQRRLNEPRAWLEALARTRHLAPLLVDCVPVRDGFSVCTAPSFVLDQVCGEHWLAVGDAASAFDPISSQGIYKALDDAVRGGQAIAASLRGDAPALPTRQREVEARFAAYAQQRAYFYEQEQRWADAPFWRERVSAR